jgi:hypothetical protein
MSDTHKEFKIDMPYSIGYIDRINTTIAQTLVAGDCYQGDMHAVWPNKQYYLTTKIKEFSKYKDYACYQSAYREGKERFSLSRRERITRSLSVVGFSVLGLVKLFMYRPKVLLYETDRLARGSRVGERLYTIMDELLSQKVSFFEFIHTSPEVPLVQNFFVRRRIVFYIEAIDIFFKLYYSRRTRTRVEERIKNIDFNLFESHEVTFAKELLRGYFEYIELVLYRSQILSQILKIRFGSSRIQKPVYVSIDDVRFVDELVYACKTSSIRTYVFQHSNFDYLMGQDRLPPQKYIFPDTFFVWNEYWKNKIVRLSPVYAHNKERLAIGGRAYNYKFTAYDRSQIQNKGEMLEVVIPYEVALTESQIRPYIEAMYQDERIVMKLVLRGDFERSLQVKKYFTDEMLASGRAIPIEPKDKFETIARADVVLGVYSGFLDEVAESLIPVAIPKTDYVTMSSLLDDQVADEVVLGTTPIYDQLVKARDTDARVLQRRKDLLTQNTGDARTIVQEILRTVGIL